MAIRKCLFKEKCEFSLWIFSKHTSSKYYSWWLTMHNFACVWFPKYCLTRALWMLWILSIHDSHFCLVVQSFKPLSKADLSCALRLTFDFSCGLTQVIWMSKHASSIGLEPRLIRQGFLPSLLGRIQICLGTWFKHAYNFWPLFWDSKHLPLSRRKCLDSHPDVVMEKAFWVSINTQGLTHCAGKETVTGWYQKTVFIQGLILFTQHSTIQHSAGDWATVSWDSQSGGGDRHKSYFRATWQMFW
jgi:hypothetical protein